MEATISLNGIWNLFSSLDMNRKDSFAKELCSLMSRYITTTNGKEDDLARRRRLFEEYAGSWNMPDEIFPDGDVMKFIKNVEKEEDEITMQLLKDCYGALECWDDDFKHSRLW